MSVCRRLTRDRELFLPLENVPARHPSPTVTLPKMLEPHILLCTRHILHMVRIFSRHDDTKEKQRTRRTPGPTCTATAQNFPKMLGSAARCDVFFCQACTDMDIRRRHNSHCSHKGSCGAHTSCPRVFCAAKLSPSEETDSHTSGATAATARGRGACPTERRFQRARLCAVLFLF